ncbi:MAG: hypothetical protein OHK0039_07410 [Bacteroidia bacterium]
MFTLCCLAIVLAAQPGTGSNTSNTIRIPGGTQPQGGGESNQISITVQPTATTDLIWVDPDPDQLGGPFRSDQEMIVISLKALSGAPLQKEQFEVFVNGRSGGSKFNETSLTGGTAVNARQAYSYRYVTTVPLQEGLNDIQVRVKNGAGTATSTILPVTYSAAKPSLHILALGPSPANLKFTAKDAEDIAWKFEEQRYVPQPLFADVRIHVLKHEQATAAAMLRAVEALKAQSALGQIKPQDVLIVFASSHGFIAEDGSFRLHGDDYDPLAPMSTSLAYTQAIEMLDRVNCKKVVLIDACHSGGARADAEVVNQAIARISEQASGVTTITSSRENQLSYEDESWENGAFTEAILEALSGKADRNRDRIVTVNELYSYLEQRVPTLVRQVKNELQTPGKTRSDLGDMPLFQVY